MRDGAGVWLLNFAVQTLVHFLKGHRWSIKVGGQDLASSSCDLWRISNILSAGDAVLERCVQRGKRRKTSVGDGFSLRLCCVQRRHEAVFQ